MKWPRWSIRTRDPNDFLPVLIGCVMLFVSLPGFIGVWLFPDRNAGNLGTALMILLGSGIVLGIGFIVFGMRISSVPGSLAYRLTHGRLFSG